MFPAAVARRFEAVVFDWDGTAVPDRRADATLVRNAVEALCATGVHVAVITGTHLGNVDDALRARPRGPGRMFLSCNRGSELFAVAADGVRLLAARTATAAEDAALDRATALVIGELADRGLVTAVVTARMNRRKIDLIPEPEWTDPPKARIAELLAAVTARLRGVGIPDLAAVVDVARGAAQRAGIPEARVTSDAKHVEIGLTDKADAARVVFGRFWSLGVAAPLVLAVGDEFGALGGVAGSDACMLVAEGRGATAVSVGPEPAGVPPGVHRIGGGPEAFVALLADQCDRRAEVPAVVPRPGWSLTVSGVDPRRERSDAALLALGDGRTGTTGAPLHPHPAADPSVLVAGAYDGTGAATDLLPAPAWDRFAGGVADDAAISRTLDLRTGILAERLDGPAGYASVRFACRARPGTTVLRAAGPAVVSGHPLESPGGGAIAVTRGGDDGTQWMTVRGVDAAVTAAACERVGAASLDRFAAYAVGGDGPARAAAAASARDAAELGFDVLASEQRAAWAQRWEAADVRVEGDPVLQQAVRVACYHLMAAVADSGEAPVGARGLTGGAYRGHVFWDADLFVLPFLAATHPPSARAMLEYRIRRLPAALRRAAAEGAAGARFPWESAATGEDVTPRAGRDQSGRVVPIRTGDDEIHIVGAVARAAAVYEDWSGDAEFAAGPGRRLLVETARYWATRIRVDRTGRGHLYGVIGPDEYHEPVDDNAYTNVLARWNLRRAAAAAEGDESAVAADEVARWRALAEALVDGYDPSAGRYEQFAGFGELEPLVIADLAPRRPITADLLLGRDRVQGAQVVKQADVVMLHHFLPDETVAGSREADLDFYEPRTAHGSSLSPAIHAAVLARAGRVEAARDVLAVAAAVDLGGAAGAAGGVHLGAMGGLWQALAFGFMGLAPGPDALTVDPHLPATWSELEVRCRFRGTALVVRAEPDAVVVTADRSVAVRVGGRVVTVGPGSHTFPRPGGVAP